MALRSQRPGGLPDAPWRRHPSLAPTRVSRTGLWGSCFCPASGRSPRGRHRAAPRVCERPRGAPATLRGRHQGASARRYRGAPRSLPTGAGLRRQPGLTAPDPAKNSDHCRRAARGRAHDASWAGGGERDSPCGSGLVLAETTWARLCLRQLMHEATCARMHCMAFSQRWPRARRPISAAAGRDNAGASRHGLGLPAERRSRTRHGGSIAAWPRLAGGTPILWRKHRGMA